MLIVGAFQRRENKNYLTFLILGCVLNYGVLYLFQLEEEIKGKMDQQTFMKEF